MPYCGLHLGDLALTPPPSIEITSFWDTAKGILYHFSMCWNVVSTWDASGRGV